MLRRILCLLILLSIASCVAVDEKDNALLDWDIIPLNPPNPEQSQVGQLRYLGGLHIKSADERFGGLSALHWHQGRLYTVIDDGRWSSFEPIEEQEMLTGIRNVEIGMLHGLQNEPLQGKANGDAESLTRKVNGEWLVGFERNHRVWRYSSLNSPAQTTGIDPVSLFGALAANNGVEALASTPTGLIACAERSNRTKPNCVQLIDDDVEKFSVTTPIALESINGKVTDADTLRSGELVLLFRGYTAEEGSGASIIVRTPDGLVNNVAVLRPPLNVDNMEGLAVHERDGRIFIYIVSDNNFSTRQRTLLMKFELIK